MWKKWVRKNVYSPARKLTSKREVSRYLSSTPEPKLNLGCGKNILPHWLNVDLHPHFGATQMDAASTWPVRENTLVACLCEHMIEHVPKPVAVQILEQAFRALAPGGKLRLVTPNLRFFAQLILGQRPARDEQVYRAGLKHVLGVDDASQCDMTNLIFYEHGHCYIYTPDELKGILTRIGFVDVTETRPGQVNDSLFENAEGHTAVVGEEFNANEAFALEATKPIEMPATRAWDARTRRSAAELRMQG